jgi:cysteine desulfuration protein SufE
MPTFPPTVEQLIEQFDELQDWDERYDFIIDLGRELPPFPEEYRREENLVKGCMSMVWMVTRHSEETDSIEILADSDSIIVKGLIAILMAHFSEKPAKYIVESDAHKLFERLGLNQHLSPQRRNGLYAMVKRLKQQSVEYLAAQAQ